MRLPHLNPVNAWIRQLKAVCLLMSLSFASAVQAHPHIWVDLQITPLFNADQALVGLHQQWQFDPFYSLVLAEDLQHPDPQRREQLKADIWQTLESMNFYTEVQLANKVQDLFSNNSLELNMNGLSAVLSFELMFSQPLSADALKASEIRYRIFEPTYYIDMMHLDQNGLILSEGATHCDYDIMNPQPSAEIRQRAIDVDDPTVAEDPTLGQHFAQTVVLRCAH